MTTIALFGTSADPPTAGHQAILKWLAQRFDVVAVWASDNPFKSHQTPLPHRLAMLQLLIRDIQPPRHNLQVYPELSHPRTIHTLAAAQTIWPDGRFTLVIGSDLVGQLHQWQQIDTILRQVKILVIPRPGYPIQSAALAELRQRGGRIELAELMGLDMSSTAYRQAQDTDVITPPVEAYIHREQLYACQGISDEKQPMP